MRDSPPSSLRKARNRTFFLPALKSFILITGKNLISCEPDADLEESVLAFDRRISKSRRRKKQKALKIAIAVLIAAVLFASTLSLLSNPSFDNPPAPVPSKASYTSHVTISISGDAQFDNTNFPNNGVVSGNGTASNPYIIEGWDINAGSASGIYIGSATAYFIVRNCYIHNSTRNGIYISLTSTPFTISGCNIRAVSGMGIRLGGCHGIDQLISNNTCFGSNPALYTSVTSYAIIRDNNFSNCLTGIVLDPASSHNLIYHNWICNNTHFGVIIPLDSTYNRIWNNTFIGNNGAGSTYNSSHIQACDDCPFGIKNFWNSSDGYGNYWSDWTTPDNVPRWGIVDKPYNLTGTAGNKDNYPLTTSPISPLPPPIPEPSIVVLAGIMIAIFLIIGNRRRE